jgi:hypothetical protein
MVTTAITAATPITTPSSVRTERNLLAHNDWSAILTASRNSMRPLSVRPERARLSSPEYQAGGVPAYAKGTHFLIRKRKGPGSMDWQPQWPKGLLRD